ncbi:anthranilate 1,2-dioxygenase regulatory protein AndR [Paraburkholderia acidisoli]|uniref:Helix-turn-helix domain-containing protein n=1 Tax=Paraburkholderia acidisoli TaxID=2571748 RepID=A0A7Z2GQK2_9BURK|nr:anthranilate 1,2-dioxygenase regulatory protein AndR [Paraburkholderia acidisoli]QGZ66166.1 helix-turn-helix domain-containing protein [Paraburkholderia acidisoli]
MPRSEFRPHALRQHRLFESTDLDETRERISRVMQPHSLVPFGEGSGRSHMDFVKLGRLGIGTIGFGSGMRVDVEAVDGYYLLMFCVSGAAEIDARGQVIKVDDRQGVIRAPGESFSALLSADCEQLILRIDPASIAHNASFQALVSGARIQFGNGSLRALQDQLKLIASSPELLTSACSDTRVGANVESLLLNLLTVASVEPALPHARHATITPSFVRRAEDLMMASLAAPLSLTDLADTVGVPVRTLCGGFLRFRQTSPMQYLRQMRLERARDVIRSTPAGRLISAIALDCGFTHFGRFSQAYKERFGELPSQTPRAR